MHTLIWKRHGKTIASPLAMITGVSIVYYPARNRTNINQYPRKHLLKGWKPFLDESGQPTVFQTLLEKKMGGQDMHTFDFIFISKPRVSDTWAWHTIALLALCETKNRAKIFHCFKLENKASSSSAPPTTSVASLYTLDPQEFFGRPRRCGCSTIRGRRVWPENTHCLLTSVKGRAAIIPKKKPIGDKSKCWKFLLMSTAVAIGSCARQKYIFTPSDRLRLLRQRRKQVHDNATRKSLSFQIRRLHRKECRQWKVSLLRQYLQHPARWKELQGISSSTSKPLRQHPPLDEFATMLEELFTGTSETPLQPNHLTEEPWTLQELIRVKLNKSADESGLVAEVFKHISNNFAANILHLYNDLLSSGHSPSSWRRTLFTMLAKHRKATLVTDFRPIASIRLFYKMFAYMILHRIEPCLDSHQPEEQHGFRAGRRLEEHLLTANLFLDKTLAANIPVWILSLDLSKAFDRVDWGALWLALSEHGVSTHLLWILQTLYFGQHGEVTGQRGNSRAFQINAGVRQGCEFSPKMFFAVLHWAMSKWRT